MHPTALSLVPLLDDREPPVSLEQTGLEELVAAKLRTFFGRIKDYPVENLYEEVVARIERPLLSLVLEYTGGNQLWAARILGLNRNTLRKKMLQAGLSARNDGKPRRRRPFGS